MKREVFPKWTDEMIQALRDNYQKLTGPELAKRLLEISGRKFTRSAIMGKVWRLGLCKPEKDIHPKPKQPKPRTNKFNTKRAKVYQAPPTLQSIQRKRNRNGALHILDLRDNQCRWVIGMPRNLMFCGKPVVRTEMSRSWCAEHHKIVYPQGYRGGRP